MIDWTQTVTAEAKAAEAFEARRAEVSAECRRRILAVVDEDAQRSLPVAALTGQLSADERETLAACSGWIGAMRAAYDRLRDDPNADFAADKAWPLVPLGVATLAAKY